MKKTDWKQGKASLFLIVMLVTLFGGLGFGVYRLAYKPASQVVPPGGSQVATLRVKGMFCPMCAASITHVLTSIKGVSQVKVSLPDENVRVLYDPHSVSPERFVDAINHIGYKASLPEEKRK